jgi:diguanylate cyclase (GGDEF)-like protein
MMDGAGDRLPLPSIPLIMALESGEFIGPVEVTIPHRQRQHVTTAQVSASPIVSGSGQVTGAVMSLVDVTERNRLRDELVEKAEQDPLTKLGNRRLLFKRVEQALEAAQVGYNIGVLYLDVDGFKEVNDLLGHQAGDDVLIVLTERIRNVVRETDTIARIGGDEFAVAIPDIPVTDTASIPIIDDICRRLLEGIAEPINIAGNTIELTASIGVAVGDRSIITKPDDRVQFADLAMYKAKTTGKARWAYYVEPEFLSHVWVNDVSTALPNALENNEFELSYRPVVQLRNGRLAEIEPVIVWSALRNETADDAIQGIAWRAGELAELIQRVGELFEHHVSSRDLTINTDHPILINRRIWIDHLRDTAVSSALVKLAESLSSSLFIPQFALIGRLDNASSTLTSRLRALSDAGASITLDRVGSSDSSLDLLQLINITSVELAEELISRAVNDSGRRNLIRGIAALTNELGIMLKATGVKTRQEFDLAGNLGCQLAAGPYFGQPMSAVELSKWNSERSLL